MVGIVIVSHSKLLAEGVADATRIMAEGCPVAVAGGLPDGSYGTDYEMIRDAIRNVCGDDGAVVLADMGSAVMTVEMVLENEGFDKVFLVDCPLAEGAIAASAASVCGDDVASVKAQAEETKNQSKW